MTRKALGKGLSALLKDRESTADSDQLELDVELLEPNRFQPRQLFSETKLEELAQSIRAHGFIQPIVVRRSGDRYQIIAGERRWRAAQRLGLSRVPATIKSISDDKLFEVSLIENIQRENLNPIEEAKAYHRLSQEFGLTQEQVAQRTGKDRSSVANFLRLLKLPKEVQLMVLEDRLSMGHARAILSMEGSGEQRALAEKTVEYAWSVRQLEKVIAASKAPNQPRKTQRADPNVRAATEKLERSLGTRVRIVEKGKKGRIEIEYYSQEELQRLYERLVNQTDDLIGPSPET
ncbi:MAG: ParB/RepB/Spo0J family partition protein [Acidobacteria bacterium]|nr:ParB/RepB/Spo0J family partition protein [Acidobacteriota bacterium]